MTLESLFIAMYLFLYLGVPTMLVIATYCGSCRVDMRDLWMYRGRVDKFAVIIMGSWWIHSCSLILATLNNTALSADYGMYMGWAIPIIAKMYVPVSNSTESTSTTTSTTTSQKEGEQ